ncbi:ABC transporter permease [Heyndrickxia sporothermodurans]|uniref:ABC transporter permease subunit n=1 Tax=Heyndrickxia sporothermodurans TaxID=46224 RepID=A0AB37HHN3_9BACI|nr:ABC transporter permease subunit [Heyndrickxia sporothermodurans]MBL5769076.1 ABC transporter permease subunit [Heyndrickxia sporothermodurans]MBL5772789.1 ABC transporter permease subunit [Heyndrickxia sporothermodurans]MBL5776211.1 ABC transporter permease subunit [Heyndrickxia sporothermodurans]MBL5786957.1 ABC transporter permease subunit [Heyndrickxia sporothermodurans]MBL5790494.1 ABC transporter permease subunit [Heyndrickxia sporothermodurans]
MDSNNRLKKLFKHPLFLIGFIFLFLLVSSSIIHTIFFHEKIPVTTFLYNSRGEIIGSGPFAPLDVPPLGTDSIGRHIFFLLIQGAKYTIGICIIVAGLRVIISSFFGLILGDYISKLNKYISGIVNGFYYIPTALLCYVLLYNVSFEDQYSFIQKVIFELIILTVVAIPTTSLLIGNQISQVYKEEFITSSKALGGSHIHILRKHVLPHMRPRLLIQFAQETVQVLILLIHLGFFHVFFGGTLEKKLDTEEKVYISLSSEWSGLVGRGFEHIQGWSWNFFGPVIAFIFVILAVKFMIKGMEDVFFEDRRMTKKTIKKI